MEDPKFAVRNLILSNLDCRSTWMLLLKKNNSNLKQNMGVMLHSSVSASTSYKKSDSNLDMACICDIDINVTPIKFKLFKTTVSPKTPPVASFTSLSKKLPQANVVTQWRLQLSNRRDRYSWCHQNVVIVDCWKELLKNVTLFFHRLKKMTYMVETWPYWFVFSLIVTLSPYFTRA